MKVNVWMENGKIRCLCLVGCTEGIMCPGFDGCKKYKLELQKDTKKTESEKGCLQ